ncbi:hypothetical protein AAON49_03010 [Pseudotenacibaculum sp. MALMAid0570]|uniref:hypothetical protein n=1 Tax=Pseudotenacibaculum sp. MALMAid0570 TaxID=3143938 RepID=UPI0032DEEEF7
MRFRKGFFFLMLIVVFGCDQRQADVPVCGRFAFVSSDLFNNAINRGDFLIQSARVEGDCLLMDIAISATCDINDTEVELIDSGNIIDSSLPERNLRLLLDTDDRCQFSEMVTVSFDLRPLRISGKEEVILNIQAFNDAISYTY